MAPIGPLIFDPPSSEFETEHPIYQEVDGAVSPSGPARFRQLKADQPYLEPKDIAQMTGADLGLVKAALSRPEKRFKPKSRVP
ncbi:MAG: hypothetical protein JWQ89_2012, partial [Devosia sp.]|uniref:hypothetical protein n=1 Tax=Devosia sp. TaxID=1871048 RepID=UPI0026038A45